MYYELDEYVITKLYYNYTLSMKTANQLEATFARVELYSFAQEQLNLVAIWQWNPFLLAAHVRICYTQNFFLTFVMFGN